MIFVLLISTFIFLYFFTKIKEGNLAKSSRIGCNNGKCTNFKNCDCGAGSSADCCCYDFQCNPKLDKISHAKPSENITDQCSSCVNGVQWCSRNNEKYQRSCAKQKYGQVNDIIETQIDKQSDMMTEQTLKFDNLMAKMNSEIQKLNLETNTIGMMQKTSENDVHKAKDLENIQKFSRIQQFLKDHLKETKDERNEKYKDVKNMALERHKIENVNEIVKNMLKQTKNTHQKTTSCPVITGIVMSRKESPPHPWHVSEPFEGKKKVGWCIKDKNGWLIKTNSKLGWSQTDYCIQKLGGKAFKAKYPNINCITEKTNDLCKLTLNNLEKDAYWQKHPVLMNNI
jgi:hypothetical protein